MSRRRRPVKRVVMPDQKFNSLLITRFVGCVLKSGKKSTAEGLIYGAFDIIEQRLGQDPMEIFQKALDNVRPEMAVKPRRVGGATYQVPVEVPEERQLALAFRWLIQYSKERGDHSMAEKLANEIIAASNNEGNSVKKKQDTIKMAKANRAFAHYRW
jgi:small subunit ribosomal protein S7